MEQVGEEYGEYYSDNSFWKKVKKYSRRAGRELIEKALVLYYVYKDNDTPVWVKGIILAALGYFISPIDAIPDVIPVGGFTDDIGAIIAATTAVVTHIKAEHIEKAREWFD